MSRGMKIFLGVIIGAIVVVTLFFYISLYGMPIKKTIVAKSVQKHLEQKYESDVELVGAVYNFKDKNYGGVFTIDDTEFYAEEVNNGETEYVDTYPNEIWTEQLVKDFTDIYKDVFPRAIRIQSGFVHHTEPVIPGPDIPNYDEVDSWLHLDLTIDEAFNADEHWEGIAEIAKLVQGKSPHISSTFSFVEEAEDRETFTTCPDATEQIIQSAEDAEKFCDQSVFTGEQRQGQD